MSQNANNDDAGNANNAFLIEQLTLHVNHLIKTRNGIKCIQEEGRQLRERLQYEETQIASLMEKLKVQECISNNTCIKITNSKRSPTTSFKNILPLIQHVFKASPDQMNSFLDEVKRFKQDNCCSVQKVVCRAQKTPKVTTSSANLPTIPKTRRTKAESVSDTVNTVNTPVSTPDDSQLTDDDDDDDQTQSLANALMSY